MIVFKLRVFRAMDASKPDGLRSKNCEDVKEKPQHPFQKTRSKNVADLKYNFFGGGTAVHREGLPE